MKKVKEKVEKVKDKVEKVTTVIQSVVEDTPVITKTD